MESKACSLRTIKLINSSQTDKKKKEDKKKEKCYNKECDK